MPAASSFADGGFMTRGIDLNHVNERLQLSLSSTIDVAEFYAKQLAEYYEGRLILGSETPGQSITSPQYWSARAAFYREKHERLKEEDDKRRSRSVTPEYIHPDCFGESELAKAKGCAENAAFRLASLPEGKAFLDAEDHGESISDPNYWRRKEKEYYEKYHALPKESGVDRARRHAYTARKKLATFPTGKALLEAEDFKSTEPSIKFWQMKE
ncbi:MAG: hypothetical protein Q9214_004715, partial [Letrouitia sp. 1 TL-2023]